MLHECIDQKIIKKSYEILSGIKLFIKKHKRLRFYIKPLKLIFMSAFYYCPLFSNALLKHKIANIKKISKIHLSSLNIGLSIMNHSCCRPRRPPCPPSPATGRGTRRTPFRWLPDSDHTKNTIMCKWSPCIHNISCTTCSFKHRQHVLSNRRKTKILFVTIET